MFVIAVGNPFDGITLFSSERGAMPFEHHEDAVEYGERNFDDDWWVVEIQSAADDEEDDTQ